MLGLGACHHINLQLFYKVTNPIHKEICKCFRFLLWNEDRTSVHPHLEWKRQQIYDLSLPRWNTEAAATSSEIQGKAQACETIVSQMDNANTGLLLTRWLRKCTGLLNQGSYKGDMQRGNKSWKWSRYSRHSQNSHHLKHRVWLEDFGSESFRKT